MSGRSFSGGEFTSKLFWFCHFVSCIGLYNIKVTSEAANVSVHATHVVPTDFESVVKDGGCVEAGFQHGLDQSVLAEVVCCTYSATARRLHLVEKCLKDHLHCCWGHRIL